MTPSSLPPRSVPHRGTHASSSALSAAFPPAGSAGSQAIVAGVVYYCDGVAWGPELTVAQRAAAVSGDGNVTDAQARAGTDLGDAVGAVRTLGDGANAGTRLRWFAPAGQSAPTWCWDIYPQSAYQG